MDFTSKRLCRQGLATARTWEKIVNDIRIMYAVFIDSEKANE